MMFSSIRSLTRLRPHSSYIFKRSININVTITRPIIHTWSRYQSTTTESIIVPDTNDPSSSSTSSSSTTTTSTSEPTITDSTPELTSDPAAEAATTTSTLEESSAVESAATPTESATSESTTSESTSTSTSTSTTKTRPKVERSKTVYIPFKPMLTWFERKIQQFGKANVINISTPEGLRMFIQYDNLESASRAAKFFLGQQYKVGELTMHLAEDRTKPFQHVPMIPSKETRDRRRVELTIPLTDPIKQYLKQFGNVEVYGMIQRFSAIAVFETEDAAMTAIEKTPKRHRYQTGTVQVNAPILKVDEKYFKSKSRPSPTTRTGTTRTKNKSQHQQSQANVPSPPPSKSPSPWNETIDPASGHTYYWHSETRQVTWDRPAELGPKP